MNPFWLSSLTFWPYQKTSFWQDEASSPHTVHWLTPAPTCLWTTSGKHHTVGAKCISGRRINKQENWQERLPHHKLKAPSFHCKIQRSANRWQKNMTTTIEAEWKTGEVHSLARQERIWAGKGELVNSFIGHPLTNQEWTAGWCLHTVMSSGDVQRRNYKL